MTYKSIRSTMGLPYQAPSPASLGIPPLPWPEPTQDELLREIQDKLNADLPASAGAAS